eukprot:CAMPEP_0202437530 /NCGR_PEP_ID=MMETSP1345-20130828/29554_1 /ASSEMBLY_ACC=CAM_ASM_000843 /TAXON_ID=342563 /ORGANISM="Fabrea Fabrea salina" /LENGTH=653 /DNA_ID=CAMNT_0049051301 /DNA_START=212 /DNA_END=2169 /DNA_ORIENTATION=-
MSSAKLDLDVSPQELLGDYKAFKTKFKNQPTYKKLPEFDCLVKASKKYPEINNLLQDIVDCELKEPRMMERPFSILDQMDTSEISRETIQMLKPVFLRALRETDQKSDLPRLIRNAFRFHNIVPKEYESLVQSKSLEKLRGSIMNSETLMHPKTLFFLLSLEEQKDSFSMTREDSNFRLKLSKFINKDTDLIYMYKFAENFNKLRSDAFISKTYPDFHGRFSHEFSKRGLLELLKPMYLKFQKELESISGIFLDKPEIFETAECMATLGILKPEFADRIIEFSQLKNYRTETFIKVASKSTNPSTEEVLSLLNENSKFESMKWNALALLEWPEPTQFINIFCEKISNLDFARIDELMGFIEELPLACQQVESKDQILETSLKKILEHKDKLSSDQLIFSLENFSRHPVCDLGELSEVINTIHKRYKFLTTKLKIRLLNCLAKKGFQNLDLIQNIVSDFHTDLYGNLKYSSDFLGSLAQLKYQNWPAHHLTGLVKAVEAQNMLSEIDLIDWMLGLVTFKHLPEVSSHLKSTIAYFNKCNSSKLFRLEEYILANYLKDLKTPVKEMSQQVDPLKHFGLSHQFLNSIKENLESKGIKCLVGHSVKNIWTPIYIPKHMTSVWPLTQKVTTSDKGSLLGIFELHKHNLTQVSKKTIVT